MILKKIIDEQIVGNALVYMIVGQICNVHDLLLEHIEQVLYVVDLNVLLHLIAVAFQVSEAASHHRHKLGACKDHQRIVGMPGAVLAATQILYNAHVQLAYVCFSQCIRRQRQLMRIRRVMLRVAALSKNKLTCARSKAVNYRTTNIDVAHTPGLICEL